MESGHVFHRGEPAAFDGAGDPDLVVVSPGPNNIVGVMPVERHRLKPPPPEPRHKIVSEHVFHGLDRLEAIIIHDHGHVREPVVVNKGQCFPI